MEKDRIVAILYIHATETKIDVDLPLKITANELVIGLNEAFQLGIDTSVMSKCFLRSENPIALLRGNRTLEEFELRDGTVIHYL